MLSDRSQTHPFPALPQRPRRSLVSRAAFAGLALLLLSAAAWAYPRPATVPTRWELHFEPGPLRIYVDQEQDQPYWYFTYTVTNRTGRDQIWAPRFVLFTDAGEIMISGDNVPSRVTRDVIDLLGNPLLENQYEVIGDILQGREHAKEGVVIWPVKNTDVTELTLLIAGISGETARVTHPITGQQVVLRKTLKRDYLVPGDPLARGSKPIEPTEQEWVFR